jgi:uncharacterized protein (TIGR02147 family)
MDKPRPSIYEYSDFRAFLKDLYSHYKVSDRHFSQRFIADKVQATSSGWFSDIISGRITLTGAYIPKVIKVFKMNNPEADFFRLLVDCNQASTLEEKNMYLEVLLSAKKSGSVVLSKDQFDYYSKWYYPAIRELLFFYDFTDDYQKLARVLNPAIRPAEAKNAIAILSNLGLIAPDKNGFFKPVDTIVKKDSSFGQIYWANYQKTAIALSSEAIERHAKDERDISSVIFCMSAESMGQAKHEIGKLRKKLLALSETDTNRNRVFQCNIQLFPVTKEQIPVKGGI